MSEAAGGGIRDGLKDGLGAGRADGWYWRYVSHDNAPVGDDGQPLAVPRFNAPLIKEALGVEHRDQLCSPAHLNNLILSPHGVDVQLRRFVEASDINNGSCLVVYRTIRCDDVVVDHKDGARRRNTLVLSLEGFAGQATYGVYQTRLGALWDCSGCVNRNVGESYMENSLICTTGPLIMAHHAPLMWWKGVGRRLEGWVGGRAYG